MPDAALAGGMPWNFAGLTAGAWQLRDPFASAIGTAPGVIEAQVPMAWYDSAAVVVGEDAAWEGFGAGLSVAKGFVRPPGSRRPRAVFTAVSGASGLDRDAIFITRGDERTWLRGGAVGDKRGAVDDLELSGDHMWTIAAGVRRGAQMLDGQFAQRGMAERQRLLWGEDASGLAGSAGWAWARRGDSLAVRVRRALDGRDELPVGVDLTTVRRDAQENGLDLTAQRVRAERVLGLRLRLRAARVVRVIPFPNTLPGSYPARVEWSTRSWWLAGRTSRPFAGGALELQLGGGRDGAAARAVERTQLSPALAWTVTQGDRRVRVFVERLVDPVWSDLAPGTAPFVQNVWAGGFDAAAGAAGPVRGDLQLVGGRVGNRGTLLRYPIRMESLRLGWTRDADRYTFLLLQSSAAFSYRAFNADAAGWALARSRSALQPDVDPSLGGRLGAGGAFRLFSGDLGLRLRAQVAYVGVRQTDTGSYDASTGLPVLQGLGLPGYASVSASVAITLGDATIVVRGDGLESTRHPETWIDPSQLDGYHLARDAGRQFRAELTWPLFN